MPQKSAYFSEAKNGSSHKARIIWGNALISRGCATVRVTQTLIKSYRLLNDWRKIGVKWRKSI